MRAGQARYWLDEIGRFVVRLVRDAQTLFWNILFFVALQLLLCWAFAADDPATALLLTSGVMALTLLSGGLYGVGVVVAGLRADGVLLPYGLAPSRRRAVLGGYLIARGALVVVACLVQLAVAVVAFEVEAPSHLGAFLLIVALAAAASVALGLVIAASSRARHVANAWANVIFVPLIVLGGVALPLEYLPDAMQALARPLPSTAMFEGVTATWAQAAALSEVLGEAAVLSLWALGGLYAGGRTFRWRP